MEKKDFPQISNGGLAEQTITLGKDEYFVLGDARTNTRDSRIYGAVKKGEIKGSVMTLLRRRGI